jgi:hypothetical protein
MTRQPALTPTAAKAAVAAGVKTAAIVNYEKYVTHPATPASGEEGCKSEDQTRGKSGDENGGSSSSGESISHSSGRVENAVQIKCAGGVC